MTPFDQHTGLVAALNRANVDTDQIIPKQFLKRIQRTGFGQFLFYDWRFQSEGAKDPEFELNHPQFQGASILLAGPNFGSGSSREHAVWALSDFGFRAVIAPSFADIFYNNCFQNGLLPVQLPEADVQQLFQRVREQPGYQLCVDLKTCRLSDLSGGLWPFEVDAIRRERLLQGLDSIAWTLQHEHKIAAFEARRTHAPSP